MSGKARGALVEDPAEERHRHEHVGLVHAGHPSRASALLLAPLRQPEGEVVDALGAATGDDHGVAGLAVVLGDHALAARGEQTLGRLADDDQVDVARPWIGQRQPDAGNRARRAHAGIEFELDAQVELRRDLGAVRVADLRPAHRAEEDRVGGARGLERRLRQRVAGGLEMLRAGRMLGVAEAKRRIVRNPLDQRQRRRDDLRADAVTGKHADVESVLVGHLDCPFQRCWRR